MDAPLPNTAWLQTTRTVLILVSGFGVWIPLLIGLWRWRSLSLPAKIIVGYFGFWAVEAVVDQWSRKVLHNNIYLYHLSVLVETWLLGWAYYHSYDLKPVRRAMLPVALAFTLLAIADACWIAGLDHLNVVTRAVQVMIMLSLVLLYFEQWVRDMRLDNPWHNLMFLVSVGLAIYYAGSVMSYLLIDDNSSAVASLIMSVIIDITYIVALGLMTLGLWREIHPRTSPAYETTPA
ncbi:hypothetical protein [Hymenobacter jeollabukensis]|uniref:Uncharacterized protein n=1 Tax=Hymenobacter jeollabukensis TaxID=2025313 RepID=A0A5R8WKS6_9BACT|nr:hypothetical protein [Hymenobacter jeollabukensis]TLM89543.1 hypothetical protein FDY95_20955 [Hymenobacter jeollabukensis]